MALAVVQIVALLPGIVFLSIGLRRLFSKFMQWFRLLWSGESPGNYNSRSESVLAFAVGILSTLVGIGWLMVFFYVNIGPGL